MIAFYLYSFFCNLWNGLLSILSPDTWVSGWPLSEPEWAVSMSVKRCFLALVSAFEEGTGESRSQHRHILGSTAEIILAPYDCRIFFKKVVTQ